MQGKAVSAEDALLFIRRGAEKKPPPEIKSGRRQMEWHRKNFDSERRSPPDAGFPCGNPKGSEQGNFARPANKHPIRRKINPTVSLGQIPKATPSGLFPADGVFSARHAAVRQAFG
jgi:hypothetical protein